MTINLLPPEEKLELIIKMTEKMVVIFGIIILSPLICLILFLISAKLYISSELISQKYILQETENHYRSAEFNLIIREIKHYNILMSRTEDFYNRKVYFSKAMQTILQTQRPEGISFSNISLKTDSKGSITADIRGKSDTRDNIILFKNNIENQEKISNVFLSSESLIRPFNVDFHISFLISYAR